MNPAQIGQMQSSTFMNHSPHLEPEGGELQEELQREEDGEDDVEDVKEVGVSLRLAVELHGEGERVDEDHGEDGVLEGGRGDEGPQLVLHGVLGDVAAHGLGRQRELDAVALVLVQLAVLVGGLALVLEGDDDEADEDVDHEEGEDDDVDDVEDGHVGTVVVHGTHVLGVRVDGHVQDAEAEKNYDG